MSRIIKTSEGTYIPFESIAYISVRKEMVSFPNIEEKYNVIIKTVDGTSHTFYQRASSVDVACKLVESLFNKDEIIDLDMEIKEKTKPVESDEPEVFVQLKSRDDIKKENPIEIVPIDIPVPITEKEKEEVKEAIEDVVAKKKATRKTKSKKDDK